MKVFSFALFFISSIFCLAQDNLKNEFQSPPNTAKPRVWWHWMNGNITKDGIKKDLDWMESVGIGGFQNFDANLFTPLMVQEKLVFMTPEWKEAFKYTTDLANEKDFEMAIAGSPGWSVTGGPWVQPEDGMKKYVWTETIVEGGTIQLIQLDDLPNVIGKFQDEDTGEGGVLGSFIGEKPIFSKDALVIAYKLPEKEIDIKDLNPKITKSGGDFDNKLLLDRSISVNLFLSPQKVGDDMWVQYEFDSPQTFKAFSIGVSEPGSLAEFNGGPTNRRLKVSNDGINFKTVSQVSNSILPYITTKIKPTTAKYWRITFETLPAQMNPFLEMAGLEQNLEPAGSYISEFNLFNTSRIDRAEDKAGFSPWEEIDLDNQKISDAIDIENVLNLTDKVNSKGVLDWEVPKGKWNIVRFGYSLTGRQNHPASPEATGLEVDKLDKEAVKKYINHYLDLYKDATGGLMGEKGLQYMILDSYEAGHMTWTKNFPTEFEEKRGYSLVPWVPVLCGRVVNSVLESEKFLWDFRKTIGEMIVENHYEVIGEELHKRGMKRYTESHENKRIYLADGMDVKKMADIPMAAMWTPGSLAEGPNEEVRSQADIREAASVANIYGQNIVAAESMTAIQNAFSWHPEKLKRTADMEMASGLNRFIIHTSVHQPLDNLQPGFSLGPFGQYFTRHETWSGVGAKAWISYLSKSAYMLQQGKNIADLLVLYGENNNITWVCRENLPEIEKGFEFDFINANGLINDIEIDNDKMVAPSGAKYAILKIHESANEMTLAVLKKILQLAERGIRIEGILPKYSPSLYESQEEFDKIVARFNLIKNSQKASSIQPDVLISQTDHEILFRHRKTENRDIYWLNNRSEKPTSAHVSFRVSNKKPELWNPQTGEIKALTFQNKNDRTVLNLDFESWDAFFIVFSDNIRVANVPSPQRTNLKTIEINNTWDIDFSEKKINSASLESWTTNQDPAIKYYSGTASYKNDFRLKKIKKKLSYSLELEEVHDIAEVYINDKPVQTLWKKPFKTDISDFIKKGNNIIELKITNTWVNRLIGDANLEKDKRSTFTTLPFYQADSPLLPAGLIGNVKITISK